MSSAADLAEYERSRARISAAAAVVRDLLDANRALVQPDAASAHTYTDKYRLMEAVGAGCLARVQLLLGQLGLLGNSAVLEQAIAASGAGRVVRLQLAVADKCEFVRESTETVEQPDGTVIETTVTSKLMGAAQRTIQQRVLQRVTTYHWHMEQTLTVNLLVADAGQTEQTVVPLLSKQFALDLTSKTKDNPRHRQLQQPLKRFEVSLAYLLRRLAGPSVAASSSPSHSTTRQLFAIDRERRDCHTPGHNEDVRECSQFLDALQSCIGSAFRTVFSEDLCHVEQARSGVLLTQLPLEEAYVPIVPLFSGEDGSAAVQVAFPADNSGVSSTETTASSFTALVRSVERSVARATEVLVAALPKYPDAVAYHQLGVVMSHIGLVCRDFSQSVSYMRGLIARQLVDAIGKVVTTRDLVDFTAFHNQRLFKPAYVPVPLCHDVRRAGHTPEGAFTMDLAASVFSRGDGDDDVGASSLTVTVMQRQLSEPQPLRLELSASNFVQLRGTHYLHGFMAHQFSTEQAPGYQLTARAREFSCFMLLLGSIGAGNKFECREGIFIQNKDEVIIPLLLETIPSAGEFRDAISSLSPEQQRFARAFREMQIASTIFAVAIIQVKPQLEKVLKLPPDSLTKEIRLTQDLVQLFTEHQIPSDLLAYSGSDVAADAVSVSVADKIAAVKQHVASVNEMFVGPLAEQEREKRMARAELQKAERTQNFTFGGGFGGQPSQLEGYTPAMAVPTTGFGSAMPRNAMKKSAAPMLMAMSMMPCPSPPVPTYAPTSASAAPPPPPVAAATAPVVPGAATDATPSDMTVIDRGEYDSMSGGDEAAGVVDYTRVPKAIEDAFERYDSTTSCNVRPTKIKVGPNWTVKSYDRLMREYADVPMNTTETKTRSKRSTMDLLDALTRSGELAVTDCSVHIVYAATHCFDETVFDTVVRKNINPLERLERSALIMASAIHGRPVAELVAPREAARVQTFSPSLFIEEAATGPAQPQITAPPRHS